MTPTPTRTESPARTFAELGVPDAISAALARRGVTEPFEIQAATIADALAGRDVCGRAPTGSGKTLAFGIPLVATATRAQSRRPTALVLAPTRELADQIATELHAFAGDVRVGVVYGGVGYAPQKKALQRGVDILVACPGRLEDLIDQGCVQLDDVDHVVLDEADRMADMGFMPAVRRILDQTADDRQTVLFSATLDGDVAKLTKDYQRDPVRHEVGEETPDITAASHVYWEVDRAARRAAAAEAINAVWPAIVFVRTRHGADRLAKQLGRDDKIKAAAIHGGRSQNQRTRALADFTKGRVHALIATDVAARGIHVDGVALVLHYDPPEDHKTYVHRSGRTARAGEGGVVLSLLQPDQIRDARKTQRAVGLDEEIGPIDAGALRDLSPGPAPAAPTVDPETPRRSSSPTHDRTGNPAPSRNRNNRRRKSANKGRGNGEPKSAGGSSTRTRTEDSRDGNGRPSSKRRTGGRKGRPGTGGSTSDRSGGAGSGSARPNRKARRAHLQSRNGRPGSTR